MGISAPIDVWCVEVNGTFIPNINATSNVKSLPNGIPLPGLAAFANPSSSLPKDLPSLILFFFSLSALREWLKLLVVGSAFEMMWRLVFYMYRKIYESFFITAVFEENDTGYHSCFSLLIDWVTPQIGCATGSLANQHGAMHTMFKFQPNHLALTLLLWWSKVKTTLILTIRSHAPFLIRLMPDKAYLSGVEIDTQMDKQKKTQGTDKSFSPFRGTCNIIRGQTSA